MIIHTGNFANDFSKKTAIPMNGNEPPLFKSVSNLIEVGARVRVEGGVFVVIGVDNKQLWRRKEHKVDTSHLERPQAMTAPRWRGGGAASPLLQRGANEWLLRRQSSAWVQTQPCRS